MAVVQYGSGVMGAHQGLAGRGSFCLPLGWGLKSTGHWEELGSELSCPRTQSSPGRRHQAGGRSIRGAGRHLLWPNRTAPAADVTLRALDGP